MKVQKGWNGHDASRIGKFTDATQEEHTNLITFDFCEGKRHRMIMIHGHIIVRMPSSKLAPVTPMMLPDIDQEYSMIAFLIALVGCVYVFSFALCPDINVSTRNTSSRHVDTITDDELVLPPIGPWCLINLPPHQFSPSD